MDGGRRTESFQCLLSGHTADMANTSPGVILGCLFLAKKGKEKEIYIVPRLSFGNVSDLLFLPDFEGLRRPDPSSC